VRVKSRNARREGAASGGRVACNIQHVADGMQHREDTGELPSGVWDEGERGFVPGELDWTGGYSKLDTGSKSMTQMHSLERCLCMTSLLPRNSLHHVPDRRTSRNTTNSAIHVTWPGRLLHQGRNSILRVGISG
jgi:hypothetical protein